LLYTELDLRTFALFVDRADFGLERPMVDLGLDIFMFTGK